MRLSIYLVLTLFDNFLDQGTNVVFFWGFFGKWMCSVHSQLLLLLVVYSAVQMHVG